MMLATIRLWRSLLPAIPTIAPSIYSLLSSAFRSRSRYSSGLGYVLGSEDMVVPVKLRSTSIRPPFGRPSQCTVLPLENPPHAQLLFLNLLYHSVQYWIRPALSLVIYPILSDLVSNIVP